MRVWCCVSDGFSACADGSGGLPGDPLSAGSRRREELEHIKHLGCLGRAPHRAHRYLFSEWTQSDPGDFRVQVHVLHETDCGTDFSHISCASSRKVQLAAPSAAFHELVHAVTRRTDGSTVPSIMEGIAEALGPGDALAETSYLAPFDPAFMGFTVFCFFRL